MIGNDSDITLIIDAVNRAKGKIDETLKTIGKEGKATSASIKTLDKNFNELDKTQAILDRTMGKTKRQFAGWAMSLMFFGMAIKRTFDTAWKSGKKYFQDAMHSIEGTVTGFDLLTGASAYLGFTIGQALEPIAAFLAPILIAFGTWISEHEKLAGGILTAFGVGGTALMALGMGKLAFNGLAESIELAKLSAYKLKDVDWSKIGTRIQQGIGLIAIGASMFMVKDAIADFKSGDWMGGMLNALGATATFIGGVLLLTGKAGVGAPLILVGAGLKLMAEDKFFSSVTSVVGFVMAAFDVMVKKIQAMLKNGIGNALLEGFYDGLSMLANFLGKGFIEWIMDVDLDKMMKQKMGITETPFDAKGEFFKSLAEANKWAEDMDTWFKESKLAGQKSFLEESTGNTYYYTINGELLTYDQIQKQLAQMTDDNWQQFMNIVENEQSQAPVGG